MAPFGVAMSDSKLGKHNTQDPEGIAQRVRSDHLVTEGY